MIVPTYGTGDWYAVVTDGTVALLERGTAPAVVAAVCRFQPARASSAV